MNDGPLILNLNDRSDQATFEKLNKDRHLIKIDEICEQIKELEFVKNPKLLLNEVQVVRGQPKKINLTKVYQTETVWVYYPWKNTLVHCLGENDFKILRTSRNQNLITKKEQKKFEKGRVGLAGLNVGNPGAVCLALEGDIEMKLADNDVLTLSNLNRFRAGLPDLGLNKAVLTARQIWEINPFAKLEIFAPEGITFENMGRFVHQPKINILVEETDHLPLKIKIREMARQARIAVIMVTGNSENVIIDIERFDLNPKLPLLNGYLSNKVIESIKMAPKFFDEKIKLARDFMGAKYLHPRLLNSFKLIGSKLAGIPQIAESSFLRGAAISYFVRRIAQGNKVKSGRYNLRLSDVQKFKKS